MTRKISNGRQLVLTLALPTLVSIGLFVYGYIAEPAFSYRYLIVNLILAWLPLLFALWLVDILRRKLWSSWEALGASLLWLLFLPNSFYIVSDLIHLQEAKPETVLYDAVMLASFAVTGIALGVCSLYLIHREIRKRLSLSYAFLLVAIILLMCSFAIYVGRDLRWNSWDALFRPGWMLLDISYSLFSPTDYGQLIKTTLSFWLLLSSIYLSAWQGTRLIVRAKLSMQD